MIGVGALLNVGKGIWDSMKIRKEEKRLKGELENDFLSDISPLEKYEYSNSLLLAESIILLEKAENNQRKIEILEKALTKMNELLKQTEQELKAVNATKLDVATLAVNIQDLTINTIKELDNQQKVLNISERKLSEFQKNVNSLSNQFINIQRETKLLKNETEALKREVKDQLSSFQNDLTELKITTESSLSQVGEKFKIILKKIHWLTIALIITTILTVIAFYY